MKTFSLQRHHFLMQQICCLFDLNNFIQSLNIPKQQQKNSLQTKELNNYSQTILGDRKHCVLPTEVGEVENKTKGKQEQHNSKPNTI